MMDAQNTEPISPFDAAMKRLEQVAQMKRDGVLVQGVDYGDIPGANKPTLLKSGAQKLMAAFNLSSVIKETVKEVYEEEIYNDKKRVISYRMTVGLQHKLSGMPEGEGVGVCNTAENTYLKRRPADMENTVLKIAKKRALVDAVLDATGSGSIFTQDVEDMQSDEEPRRQQSQRRPGANRPPQANGAARNGQQAQQTKPQKLTAMQELMARCERQKFCIGENGKAVVNHIVNSLKDEGFSGVVTDETLEKAWNAIKTHYGVIDDDPADVARNEQLALDADEYKADYPAN